jgi:transposase
MNQARYSAPQLRTLDEARFSQKTDAINRRVNAVYFYGLGRSRAEAARLANVCCNTLRKFAGAFESGGLEAVTADARQGPPSALDPHVDAIKADLAAHPPASVAQAADRIASLTGVRLQATRVRTFMRGMGMAPRRLSPIPGKADPIRQADFKKTAWIPC